MCCSVILVLIETNSMKCCVLGCDSYTDRRFESVDNINITFHKFPADEALRQLWIKNINRLKWTPTVNSKVCSRHFQPDDFRITHRGLRILKNGKLPTLYLDLADAKKSSGTTIPELTVLSSPEHTITGASRLSLLERTKSKVKEYLILSDAPGTDLLETNNALREEIQTLRLKAKIDGQKIRTQQKAIKRLNQKVRRLTASNRDLRRALGAQYPLTKNNGCELSETPNDLLATEVVG